MFDILMLFALFCLWFSCIYFAYLEILARYFKEPKLAMMCRLIKSGLFFTSIFLFLCYLTYAILTI